MKVGNINIKKIPKVQFYVLFLSLFTTTAWWLRTVFILEDDKDKNYSNEFKISKKQYYALAISLFLSIVGWVETMFLFNSIKCRK